VPQPRMCDPALTARHLLRAGAVVPRTWGSAAFVDDATRWSAVLSLSHAPSALSCSCFSGARATVRAVERFYTTVELIRERATEGWHVLTLALKEKRSHMTEPRADTLLVRRWQPPFVSKGRVGSQCHGMMPCGRCEGSAGMAALPSVSRRGVAVHRDSAVFCQQRRVRSPRLLAFDGCGHPATPDGLRRYED
jgi:hypothetical protein